VLEQETKTSRALEKISRQKTGRQQKSRDTKKRPESQSSAQNGVGENLWRGRLSATAKTGVWEQLRIDTGRVAKIDSRKNPTALGAQTEPGNGSPEATLTGNKENRNLVTLA
jgi:hypothetical protein